MPIQDRSTSRARLVDIVCFINKKSGAMLWASRDQMISIHVWRVQLERISVNTVQERSEEVVGVYTKRYLFDSQVDGEIFSCADQL